MVLLGLDFTVDIDGKNVLISELLGPGGPVYGQQTGDQGGSPRTSIGSDLQELENQSAVEEFLLCLAGYRRPCCGVINPKAVNQSSDLVLREVYNKYERLQQGNKGASPSMAVEQLDGNPLGLPVDHGMHSNGGDAPLSAHDWSGEAGGL